METTKKNRDNMVQVAVKGSLLGLMVAAMAALPTGCIDEEEAGAAEQVSTKTGALNGIDSKGQSFGKYGKLGKRDGRDGMGRHKRGKRGGKRHDAAGILFKTALAQDSLTEAQRSEITSLMAGMKQGRRGQGEESRKAFMKRMAEAVRDGNIDTNVMASHFESRAKHREERMAARAKTLDALYAALEPAQRQAVVAEVKAKWSERGERFKKNRGRRGDGQGKGFGKGQMGKDRFGKGASGMRDKFDRERGGKGFPGKRGRRGGRGDGIFALVKGLDLTEEQQAQIAALKPNRGAHRPDRGDREERRAKMAECRMSFLDSFASDSFSAANSQCREWSGDDRRAEVNQHATNLKSLIGILTDAQRQELAERLENPPQHRGKGRTF